MRLPFPSRLGISLLLLFSLLSIPHSLPLGAADARWSEVPLPRTGAAGDWTLTPDTDITQLETDSQGRLYAWITGNDGGLFRSDEERTRFVRLYPSDTAPVALTVTGDDKIYCATDTAVYRSNDGGTTFQQVAGVPGGTGNRITDMDILPRPQGSLIITAVAGGVPGSGGVYLYDESDFFGRWQNAGLENYDLFAVRFSPTFEQDRTLLAMGTDDNGSCLLKLSSGVWQRTELRSAGDFPVTADSGKIQLPAGFDTSVSSFYLTLEGADAATGGIWIAFAQGPAQAPVAFPLPVPPDDYSLLSISGGKLTAGTAAGDILVSNDTGLTWAPAVRQPGGTSITGLIDLGTDRFAASSGTGGGLFHSSDNGLTWSPAIFIDQAVTGSLVKILPSSDYALDNTLYLLSFDNGHTLWNTDDDGFSWRRLLGVGDFGLATIEHIFTGSSTLAVAAVDADGNGVYLVSTDRGTSFQAYSLPIVIDSLNGFAIASGEIFFTTFDGNQAHVWHGMPGSQVLSSVAAGDVRLTSLELSPDFRADRTMVTATADGRVFISTDRGESLTELPALPLSGYIRMVFDPLFAANGRIYAAGEAADTGIFRLSLGQTDWTRIDSGLHDDTLLSGLAVSPDGIIYATDRRHTTGGLIRALDTAAAWHTARQGLPDMATLTDLVISGQRLWALDTTANRIMTWDDTLAVPVNLISPSGNIGGLGVFSEGKVSGIRLEWAGKNGATNYEWQLADNPGMTAPIQQGTTAGKSSALESLFPGTTYYWRVRAVNPVPGPWSEKRAFTTAIGGVASVPELVTPLPGATGADTRPFFQWRPVAGAETYELLVATDSAFGNVVINESSLPSTAWRPTLSLEDGQTYFWKVRAISGTSASAWSAASGFATETPAAPAPTTESAATTTIAANLDMALPEWLAMTLAGAGGAVVLLLIALVVGIRNRRVL